jgi:phosphoglycerate kinase
MAGVRSRFEFCELSCFAAPWSVPLTTIKAELGESRNGGSGPRGISAWLGLLGNPISLTREQVIDWCVRLVEPLPDPPALETYLSAISTLDDLTDLPPRTRVLVRCDTNVVVRPDGTLENESRLRSLLDTLRFGREHGWVQIIHGHIGTDGRQSLQTVVPSLTRLLEQDVSLIPDWMDDNTGTIADDAAVFVSALAPGAIALLENARRYSLELCLWRAGSDDVPALADRLTCYANGVRAKLARVHVNEAFAASNRDLSSTLVPMAMDRVALGYHVRGELIGPVNEARQADLVVFSGAKLNKLDDLERILQRRRVHMILAAGLLALPLLKAAADQDGRPFEMGIAGAVGQDRRPDYVSPDRVTQAHRLLREARDQGVQFILPIDFVLEDGAISRTIPVESAARDVGPATCKLYTAKISEFLVFHRRKQAAERRPAVVFHNGVFGVFEQEEFAKGTRAFLVQLRRLHDAGVRVYVGGGEGGTALHRFGRPDCVTHCFTAGTTILKALGVEPIPYIKALYLASRSRCSSIEVARVSD